MKSQTQAVSAARLAWPPVIVPLDEYVRPGRWTRTVKRLPKKLLIVVASLCATLLVLELGYRGLLAFRGEAHSSAARLGAYVGQLEWILRPHGPIAMGAAQFDELNSRDLIRPASENVLSPYLGVDLVALMDNYAPLGRYFSGPEAEANFDVLLLGGSVAGMLGADAESRRVIEEVLAADPRLAGRSIRLHGQGRAGFKAPQTSILCDLLFQFGWRPDLVVLLDGFNEVAMANETRLMGAHPIYPPITTWGHLAPEVDMASADIDRLVEMRVARQASLRLLQRTLRFRLYRSALASRLMDALISRPTTRHFHALRALELRRNSGEMPLALRGPEPPADFDTALELMLRIWVESSTSLGAACQIRGIPFLHVLQPTLFDEGAKPISEKERRTCHISDAWREATVNGYPLLRERSGELRRRGIDFADASRIFAEWTGDLYFDACHFTSPGSQALARFIAERARKMPNLVPTDR